MEQILEKLGYLNLVLQIWKMWKKLIPILMNWQEAENIELWKKAEEDLLLI